MVRICEHFTSIQGEGARTGIPSLFIRSFGCNLCCAGFGQPDPADPSTWHKVEYNLGESPKYGCDSPISWHPKFKELAKDYAPDTLFEELTKEYSKDQLKELVITGGEPMLHQKFWLELFSLLMDYLPNQDINITFETNGIVAPIDDFMDMIIDNKELKVLFSISPKLNCVAGVDEKISINYDTLNAYTQGYSKGIFDIQLKFVYNGDDRAYNKVKEVYDNLNPQIAKSKILLMPVGAWETEQELRINTADACIKEGYRYCARVHVDIWGKKTGV